MTHDGGSAKLRLAMVSFGYSNYTEPVADSIRERISGDVPAAGVELVDLGVVYERDDALKALARLKQTDCHGVLGVLLSWCSPAAAMGFFKELAETPLLLYGVGARTDKNGILQVYSAQAGSPALLHPLRKAGLRFQFVFESPDEPTLVDDVLRFARAARAFGQIRRSRVGTFGFLDMSLLTTTLDTARLRLEIGPEVISFDLLDVANRAEELPEEAWQPYRDQLSGSYTYVNERPGSDTTEKTARLTAAVEQIAREKALDGITIKCVEGMSASMGLTPCMIGSMLGDRIPYICENDLPGIATHVILHKLTEQTVTFLETYEFWKQSNSILLGACGFLPSSMADGPLKARTFKLSLFEGIGSVCRMRTGRMTLARLIPDESGFIMHIVTGCARRPPDWVETGYSMPSHPSVQFELDGQLSAFVDHIAAQHFSLVYGDHAESLTLLCRLLGIETVMN